MAVTGIGEHPSYHQSGYLRTKGDFMDDWVRECKFDRRYIHYQFRDRPIAVAPAGAGAATGSTGDTNLMLLPGHIWEYHIKGTQTILSPAMSANGLDIAMDNTASDGVELTLGITALSRFAFVVGTDAAFFLKLKAKLTDASGSNPFLVGFRKAEAYQAVRTNYADYAAYGVIGTSNPNLIKIETNLASGGAAATDTTETWADAATKTLEVYVDAAGVVTFKKGGVAPTATAAFTFANGAVVVPFIYHLQAADVDNAVDLIEFECGLQTSLTG